MKISVIIPVYNTRIYLQECLDSVLRQRDCELEVICVDDGSTDGSAELLDRFASQDGRIHVIHQENRGSGPARNLALDAATGDAVAFMDPDDYYPSDEVLSRLAWGLMSSGLDMVGGGVCRVPEDDTRAIKYNAGYSGFPHQGCVDISEYQSPFRYTSFLYRRSFLESERLRFSAWRRFQDPPFLARALIAARKFLAIRECVYCYRLPEKGKSVDWQSDGCLRLREFLGGFRELLTIAERNGCQMMYREALGALANAHRFDGLDATHPLWSEVIEVCRRMRASGWTTRSGWGRVLRRMYGEGFGRTVPFKTLKAVVGLPLALSFYVSARLRSCGTTSPKAQIQ